ncbi:hypothetical protein THASP1DRAFT_28888 [Thamnocephalis sphaerospora]|uniref:Kinetochore protein Spc24 n=1 Tax=Thamnocephalis sphaerospora TaxID=78915 RepID=A0A4P9XT40_9FUNG|nr:hypothetical protein THASP1DRAFT_28888 [Thamnocephalis sphaerospora]|eukprot:RKP09307.1 hypothetical protein THASP1DRAFT_28888 [Thamnocephalis sphaerospora]
MSHPTLNEPRELIDSLVATYQPGADLAVVNGIVDRLRTTEQIRARQRSDMHKELKALSRQLEIAKGGAQRPKDALSEQEHADLMVRLDRENTLLESQLRQLKEELVGIDEHAVDTEVTPDSTALVLKIYRALGVEPILDASGNFSRVKIRILCQMATMSIAAVRNV